MTRAGKGWQTVLDLKWAKCDERMLPKLHQSAITLDDILLKIRSWKLIRQKSPGVLSRHLHQNYD